MRASLIGTVALSFALAAGCATAGGSGDDDDDDDIALPDARPPGTPDARPQGTPDAAPGTPDAPPGTPVEITLSQTTATSITAGNSVACVLSDPVTMVPLYHRANSYYRSFSLPAEGVTSSFTVSKVTVGVESATAYAGAGTQNASVALHTVSGTFPTGTLTPIGTPQSFAVADTTTGVLIDVPITRVVPAGSTLVVEFAVPDGEREASVAGDLLFPGSNDLGQTGASYLTAADCGAP